MCTKNKQRFLYPKTSRILKSKEYREVIFNNEKFLRFGNYRCFVKTNNLEHSRFGVSVSKNVGNAVVRNRIKRYAREFFRLHQYQIPLGIDVLFVIKKYRYPVDLAYFNNPCRFKEILKRVEK